jgi:hypothetical protein
MPQAKHCHDNYGNLTPDMKKKPRTHKMVATIQVRCSEQEKNYIKGLAGIYAGGNLSLWLMHGAKNAPREFLVVQEQKKKKRP